MQKQGGGSYDVRCGCDMQKPLPDWAYSLSAARNAVGGTRKRKRTQAGGSCGACAAVAAATTQMRGGGCGCGSSGYKARGGGCGCNKWTGGYKATKRNRKYLAKWRRGKSIGFTMTASLKAKGLIPRTSKKHSGKKVLGNKYK
jgi:hypothetical protein